MGILVTLTLLENLPCNLGGHVSCLVWGLLDTSHPFLYLWEATWDPRKEFLQAKLICLWCRGKSFQLQHMLLRNQRKICTCNKNIISQRYPNEFETECHNKWNYIQQEERILEDWVMFLLVFMCFKTKWGELSESTTISCSVEPLKETPQEAEWEELAQHSHLFPVTVE